MPFCISFSSHIIHIRKYESTYLGIPPHGTCVTLVDADQITMKVSITGFDPCNERIVCSSVDDIEREIDNLSNQRIASGLPGLSACTGIMIAADSFVQMNDADVAAIDDAVRCDEFLHTSYIRKRMPPDRAKLEKLRPVMDRLMARFDCIDRLARFYGKK